VSHLGHGFRPVSQDPDRRRQPSGLLRQVLAQRKVHLGCHARQHPQVVGLQQRQVPENVQRPQKRKVLHLRKFFGDRWKVDRFGVRGQPGLHLEPADEGDRSEVARSHRRRPVHGLPPDREHHRVGVAGERQDHQTVEE